MGAGTGEFCSLCLRCITDSGKDGRMRPGSGPEFKQCHADMGWGVSGGLGAVGTKGGLAREC